MSRFFPNYTALLMAFALAACAHRPTAQTAPALDAIPELHPVRSDSAAFAQARADSVRRPYVQADVDFMTGMIAHHAQAIAMSRLARGREADPAVQRLASRIMNAQVDEISTMQQWLSDRRKPVPQPDFVGVSPSAHAGHGDHSQHAMMAGMLTPQQLDELR